MDVDVAPGTIQIWSDIGCPWAHLAVARLHRCRAELGLEGRVAFDHRAFPLELFNRRPTPKPTLDLEIDLLAGLDPDTGWKAWQAEPWTWPVTTLPALEAVQAAREQTVEAAEQLDRALRRALFEESRCISMRHVVLEAAAACPAVDLEDLTEAFDGGGKRQAVIEHWHLAERIGVQGSPHLFLPDGTDAHNPGITMHWEGERGSKRPVVDADEPSIHRDLLQRAAR